MITCVIVIMGNVPLAIGQAFERAVFVVGINPTIIGKGESKRSDLFNFCKFLGKFDRLNDMLSS